MTTNGKWKKTVAELREALERLNEEWAGYLATIADAEAGIKDCARAIFDGDREAGEKRSLSKLTITSFNGNAAVARTATIVVQGA
jgi:hypothetical protein